MLRRAVTEGLADNESKKPQANSSKVAESRYLSTVHHQSETRLLRARDLMISVLYSDKTVQGRYRVLECLSPFLKVRKLIETRRCGRKQHNGT